MKEKLEQNKVREGENVMLGLEEILIEKQLFN